MNDKDICTIVMEATFPEPFASGEAKEDSALIRPYGKFIKDGSKMGKIVYLFYQEAGEYPTRLLGSLLYSEKERLIFFPGLNIRKYLSNTRKNRKTKNTIVGHELDHVTLEKHRKDWHFTSLTSKRKEVFGTYEIANGVCYWFGMSIRQKEDLEVTPASAHILLNAPDIDSKRRTEELMYARHKSEFPLIQMNMVRPSDSFIHFDFLVDTRFLSKYRTRAPLSYTQPPDGPPVLEQAIEQPAKVVSRHYRILIPTFTGAVIVNATFPKGKLLSEAFITSVSKRY